MKTVDIKQQNVRAASTLIVYAKIAFPLVSIECILFVYSYFQNEYIIKLFMSEIKKQI
jgi:hypothetical protein